jgi:hypothetical protein
MDHEAWIMKHGSWTMKHDKILCVHIVIYLQMNTEWQSMHSGQTWKSRQAKQLGHLGQLGQVGQPDHPVMSNGEYRRYLTLNATNIMSQNMHESELANSPTISQNSQNGQNGENPDIHRADGLGHNTPYIFQGLNDITPVRNNTFSSDLKRSYISRMQHQITMSAPDIYFDNR